MINLVPGLIGLTMFAAFVGLLGWRIGEWPLGIIIVAAVLMASWSLFEEIRGSDED